MNSALRFTLTTFWVIFSRAFDAYCTMQYTPDLSLEANPLVSFLGFGWTPLLLVIGALTLYIIYTYYLRTFKPMELAPNESGYTINEFAGYLYSGKKEHWLNMFYRLPGSWKRFNHYMGMYMIPGLVYAGIVSTLMWLLINHTNWYLKDYHSAKAIYGALVVGLTAIIIAVTRKEYQVYSTASK